MHSTIQSKKWIQNIMRIWYFPWFVWNGRHLHTVCARLPQKSSRKIQAQSKENIHYLQKPEWRRDRVRVAGCCVHIKCLKQIPKLDVKFLCVCFRTWATLHKSFCIKRDSIHLDIKSGWSRSWLDTGNKCWRWAGINQGKLSINKCYGTCTGVLWLFLYYSAF